MTDTRPSSDLLTIISLASGPLSGIFRILDSPRAMKRIQDQEKGPKKVEPKPATPVAPQPQVKTTAVQPVRRPPSAARQVSEDDEIAKIKRENKAAGSSSTPAAAETPSILKKTVVEEATDVSQVPVAITLCQTLCSQPNVYDLFVRRTIYNSPYF